MLNHPYDWLALACIALGVAVFAAARAAGIAP